MVLDPLHRKRTYPATLALQRRGLLDEVAADPLWEREPLLAAVTSASIRGQMATGDRAGQRLRRRLVDEAEGVRTGRLCFSSRGFSLHAATRGGHETGAGWNSCAAT